MHPLGATDFSTYFTKIMAAKPEVLVMNNLGADQTAAIKQLSELGLTKKMKIVCTQDGHDHDQGGRAPPTMKTSWAG